MTVLPRRVLAGLGVEVSAIGAGCWTIGGPATNNNVPIGWDRVDPDAALAGLHHAHDLGVTLYDTADVYGLGRSERLLGRLLSTIDRTTVTVSSKVGYFAGTSRHPYTPAQIRHQFATTLDNLGTDYLDIYHLHSTDFGPHDQHLKPALDVIHHLRDRGQIRAIGIRAPHTFAAQWATTSTSQGAEAARFLHLFHTIRPDILTVRYNLLSPLYQPDETDIFTLARHHRVGVVIKQALAQGLLLTPPHQSRPRFTEGDHRSRDPLFQPAALAALRQRLAPLRERFGSSPGDLARVALRYALHHAPDSPVLVGFRDADQIHTTITSLGPPLTTDELTDIRNLLQPPVVRKA